jgi:hypothetical protein
VKIKIVRNIQGFPLAAGITKEKRLELMNLIKDACELLQDDFKGKFYQLEGLEEDDKRDIKELIF